MSNSAKLKKKAAEFEQKKQFDKALALYTQALEESDGDPDEADVALYNRVGDLLLRVGNVGDALGYYEKAVDLYAEGGFLNNAIALCNKILRQSPGRTAIYYKLGKISANKGFKSDAKKNFLEYADRMQKGGRIDEAFRALKEFADLCPDQDDIRLLLAEQLSKENRKDEALEQLHTLYSKLESEGREAEARATLDRMKAIDPSVVPRASGSVPEIKSPDLIFLDISYESPKIARGGGGQPPHVSDPELVAFTKTHPPGRTPGARATPGSPNGALTPPETLDDLLQIPLDGSEPISLIDLDGKARDGASGIDATIVHGSSLGTPAEGVVVARMEGLEHTSLVEMPSTAIDVPDAEPMSGSEFAELTLDEVEEHRKTPAHDLKLPSELPLLVPPEYDVRMDLDTRPTYVDEVLDLRGPPSPDSPSDEIDSPIPLEDSSLPMLDLSDDGAVERPATTSELQPPATTFGRRVDSSTDLLDVDSSAFDFASEESPRRPSPASERSDPVVERPSKSSTPPGHILPAADLANDERAHPGSKRGEADLSRGVPVRDIRAALSPLAPAGSAKAREQFSSTSLRQTESSTADPLGALRSRVERAPRDWGMRRQLAEALLDAGDRASGLLELERAMLGLESDGDLEAAETLAQEIIRLAPASVRHHQKRVEYAVRTNDRGRLIDAYLELADALFRGGEPEKARVVYHRVLELAPEDPRAEAALAAVEGSPALGIPASMPHQPAGSAPADTGEAKPRRPPPPSAARPQRHADEEFVDLGEWLRGEEGPKSTRMVVEEKPPTGDEEADFQDMLRRFKQGVAENVDEEDYESHYDLGVAYKEMGLLDEAIGEFQKSLRGTANRVRSYEALGQCFLEKSQFHVASTILSRALAVRDTDDQELVGVLYLLGYACEALQQYGPALGYYQRVFAVDIDFRDVAERITAMERMAK